MTGEVRAGQVWADSDPRAKGRTLRVDSVRGDHALCTILTNDDLTAANLRDGRGQFPNGGGLTDRRGKQTRIKLSRFRPVSTGYRLVSQPADENGQALPEMAGNIRRELRESAPQIPRNRR